MAEVLRERQVAIEDVFFLDDPDLLLDEYNVNNRFLFFWDMFSLFI